MNGKKPLEDNQHKTLDDTEFKAELLETIPHLRAFGRSLCGNPEMADDLVQETMLKAWTARQRFAADTNMRAWTFTILRNLFLSQMRRSKFSGAWDEGVAEKILSRPASQDNNLELADLQRALLTLPTNQREAVILIGAGGFAYEEAARICDCAVGTIKSRVARARKTLVEMYDTNSIPEGDKTGNKDNIFDDLMKDIDTLINP